MIKFLISKKIKQNHLKLNTHTSPTGHSNQIYKHNERQSLYPSKPISSNLPNFVEICPLRVTSAKWRQLKTIGSLLCLKKLLINIFVIFCFLPEIYYEKILYFLNRP